MSGVPRQTGLRPAARDITAIGTVIPALFSLVALPLLWTALGLYLASRSFATKDEGRKTKDEERRTNADPAIGDWREGIGRSPYPNRQSPVPDPRSPGRWSSAVGRWSLVASAICF